MEMFIVIIILLDLLIFYKESNWYRYAANGIFGVMKCMINTYWYLAIAVGGLVLLQVVTHNHVQILFIACVDTQVCNYTSYQ